MEPICLSEGFSLSYVHDTPMLLDPRGTAYSPSDRFPDGRLAADMAKIWADDRRDKERRTILLAFLGSYAIVPDFFPAAMPPHEIKIFRSGAVPLLFVGTQIASASEWILGRTRWYELRAYRAGARVVVEVAYLSAFGAEPSHFAACGCEDSDTVCEFLRNFSPLGHLLGWPEGAQFEARQSRLQKELLNLWDFCVGRLLSQIGLEERL